MPYSGFDSSGGGSVPSIIPSSPGVNLSVLSAAVQNGSITYEDILKRLRDPEKAALERAKAAGELQDLPIKRKQELDAAAQVGQLNDIKIQEAKYLQSPAERTRKAALDEITRRGEVAKTLGAEAAVTPEALENDRQIKAAQVIKTKRDAEDPYAIGGSKRAEAALDIQAKGVEEYTKRWGVPPQFNSVSDSYDLVTPPPGGITPEQRKQKQETDALLTKAFVEYFHRPPATNPDGSPNFDELKNVPVELNKETKEALLKLPNLNKVERGIASIDEALTAINKGTFFDTGAFDQLFQWWDADLGKLKQASGGMQGALLALTRVPGIGSQSDLEGRVAALQYPSVANQPEVNKQALEELRLFVADLRQAYKNVLGEKDFNKYAGAPAVKPPPPPSAPPVAPTLAPKHVGRGKFSNEADATAVAAMGQAKKVATNAPGSSQANAKLVKTQADMDALQPGDYYTNGKDFGQKPAAAAPAPASTPAAAPALPTTNNIPLVAAPAAPDFAATKTNTIPITPAPAATPVSEPNKIPIVAAPDALAPSTATPAPTPAPDAASAAPDAATAPVPIEPGNIELDKRPRVKLPGGDYATVNSITVSFTTPKGDIHVLLPTITKDGKIMNEDEAVEHFKQTHEHLGIFKTGAEADRYGQLLHEAQAKFYKAP
jgi:hypothetical protein